MNTNPVAGPKSAEKTQEKIAYLHQMLGELRIVAKDEGADMLCYLIEMAYVEASDLLTGRRPLSPKSSTRLTQETRKPF
jgi:hypothetical protein